jgi:molecular chaperone GrpE
MDLESQPADQPDALEPDVQSPLDGTMTPEVRELQQERDTLYDRLARATADFRNAQRRLEQDKQQAIQYANTQLIKSLLPVIDNLERALAVDPAKTDAASILKGMQIVHDQWMDVLRKNAVEPVAPQPGDHFDPAHHEALMHQPSDQYPAGTVLQLLQKGYTLHGRTLRPAGVSVAKKTQEEGD